MVQSWMVKRTFEQGEGLRRAEVRPRDGGSADVVGADSASESRFVGRANVLCALRRLAAETLSGRRRTFDFFDFRRIVWHGFFQIQRLTERYKKCVCVK